MANQSDNPDLDALLNPEHKRAEFVYGVAAFLFAVFLLTQFRNQTVWVDGLQLTKQPAFWPIVSILGMVVFGTFELIISWRRFATRQGTPVFEELVFWLHCLEWPFWFLGYVLVVPYLGYLPTTLVYFAILSIRLGYRSPRMILIALVTGLVIVLIFKSFLSVKIPGGLIYNYLPDALRNFLIINF